MKNDLILRRDLIDAVVDVFKVLPDEYMHRQDILYIIKSIPAVISAADVAKLRKRLEELDDD